MTKTLAKFLMKRWETIPPSPDEQIGELQEVFRHEIFLNAKENKRREIMLQSSSSKYESEINYPWDNYFGIELKPLLEGKEVLDLGCLAGGRGAAWFERYRLKHLCGIDVSQPYIDAAVQFAASKNINAQYEFGKAEHLPYADEQFDAVLSFDVFEHVQDVEKALAECFRVLRPGGKLFVVFPGYYQPIEHHLSLVTKAPSLHWFFSGKSLVKAYCEILEERGAKAYWYKRQSPELEPWEKGHTINGTTLGRFRALLKKNDWNIVLHSKKPIGTIGRRIAHRRALRLLSLAFYPLVLIPGLQEIFLHRITFILEKRN